MIEVLLTRPFQPRFVPHFTEIDGCRITYDLHPDEQTLKNAEVIIGLPTIDELRIAEDCKWLQTTNAGVNQYTAHPELFENRVLTNLSGAFGQSISEFSLAMVLMLYKHLHLYRDQQRENKWADLGLQDSPRDKHLLILGAGNIGCEAAKLFSMFTPHITGMRRTKRETPEYFEKMITPDELDDELPNADIVLCALPESPETHKLMDERRLSLLKKTAILVNVGRGTLIDSDALAKVLNEGRILGAAIDVTDPEPLPASHPLWQCKNLILTPHITGGSIGHLAATEQALTDICTGNLRRYVAGKPLLNRVDPQTGCRAIEDRWVKGNDSEDKK